MSSGPDATELLSDLSGGDGRAADILLPLVYDELRQIAQTYISREPADQTLEPTALVHEAYLKLVDQTRVDWQGRTHFKAVAAQAMCRLLVDHARSRNRRKRGGGWRRISLYDAYQLSERNDLDALSLQEALDKMRGLDGRQAEVVELRLFGGLSNEEAARILGVSTRTVERDWKMGQAWLRRELSRGATG